MTPLYSRERLAKELTALIPYAMIVARRYSRQPEEAEDVVSDSLIKALNAYDALQTTPTTASPDLTTFYRGSNGASLKSWFCSIVRNRSKDIQRTYVVSSPSHNTRRPLLLGDLSPEQDPSFRPHDMLLEDLVVEEVAHKALSSLSDSERICLILYIEGHSPDVASALLGLRVKSVKGTLHRAKEKCRLVYKNTAH